MTIQVVDISALGIVCAADSAITFEDPDKNQESWPKLFAIQRLKAVIGYYGHADVGRQGMPDWLQKALHHTRAKSITDLALELQHRLAQ